MPFKLHLKQILAIFCMTFLLNCKKETITDSTYFGGKVMILGHRGMGVMYNKPANSYESIADAIGIGADGCEVDVQLTKDSVLVIFHDETLNFLTNCSGKFMIVTGAI